MSRPVKVAEVGSVEDELRLFLVREVERLNLLMERLRDRGVLTDEDFAVSSLDAEVRDLGRRVKIAKKTGNEKLVEQLGASLRDTKQRLEKIQ